MTHRLLCSVALAVSVGSAATAVRVRGQQPAFKTAAEALAVDVNVLDGSGTPVDRAWGVRLRRSRGRPAAAGHQRPMDIQHGPGGCARRPASDDSRGIRLQSVTDAPVRPLVVIAVDEVNLPPGALSGMQTAVGDFIDRVAEANPIAVVGLGVRSVSTSFTTDRDRLKKAVALMRGQQTVAGAVGGFFDMGLSVALRISSGDVDLVDAMIARDCIVKFRHRP